MPLSTADTAEAHRLPQPLTPFIGRRQEIAEIYRRLTDPDCRLLTVCGTGGIGKTRLAIAVATKWRDEGGSVAFVDLQPVQAPGFLVPAIAGALNYTHSGQDDPKTHLFHYLRDKEMLLVLDNFEHLTGNVGLLEEILQTAPQVKLLVTSRVVLNLQEEWLYPTEGLRFPDPYSIEKETAAALETYDAMQLFLSCTQRVRPHFEMAAEAKNVARLCQLVEGMPLAIELAAAWTKTLSPAAIVEEIQRDLAFLSASMQNVPEKHRSIQVVFQRSWQLLTPKERQVFQRLSVFHGGFERKAAVAVASASLPALAALVDKSLLRWRPDGRYQIHELLRQFAAAQLASDTEMLARTRDLHAGYYTGFLGARFAELTGGRQLATLAEIAAELDNIRAAWQWATDHGRFADLEYAAMALHTFFQYQGRFLEGAEAFATAATAVEASPRSRERDRALAVLLTCAGWLQMRLGHILEACQAQEMALALYEENGLLPPPGAGTDPLNPLAVLAVLYGDYEKAWARGKQAWQRAAARADKQNMAYAGYGLASTALAQGNHEAARHYAQETLALTKAVGNRWFMAYIYNQLGQINLALGDATAAGDYYQASYAIREEFNDPEGMAVALSHLGEIALAQEAYRRAYELYRHSRGLYQKLGDRGGLVRALHGLGTASYQTEKTSEARRHFERALRIASDAQIVPLTLSLLAGIGAFLIERGSLEIGLATLAFVTGHETSEQTTKEQARQLLRTHGSGKDPAPSRVFGRPDPTPPLDTIVTTLLAELSRPLATGAPSPIPPTPSPPTAELPILPLLDPLSEREREVLHLIAAGLKNREIAGKLTVALSTVKTHINNIYGKLGVSNRVQAVTRAREMNLLD